MVLIRPASTSTTGTYRVQAGDTLYKIAFESGVDFHDLATWNILPDPDRIYVGETLRVVPPRIAARPPLAPGSAPRASVVALAAPVSVSPLQQATPPEDSAPDLWAWPLRGQLLARFGEGLSKGIDIAGPRGAPVLAAASGRVVYAGSGLRGYGKLIIIRHGKTLLSAYAHNARILVKEGQNVVRGQAVGEVGDSDADRLKLHFEIRELGKPVDPLNYLPNAG